MDLSALLFDSQRLPLLMERGEGENLGYSEHQRHLVRICSLSSSSVSIVSGLMAFYFLGMLHPAKRMFRHTLITILISFDFLKAVMLLVYPASSENSSEGSVTNMRFLNAIGWLTSFSIEGADLVIVYFAVHIALLIFRPALGSKTNTEGGLFVVRHYIYVLALVIPVILSSLTFAGNNNYTDQISWSYMEPLTAVWYLTWIIRYCIAVLIVTIYGSVYYHVMREYTAVSSKMDVMGHKSRGMVTEVLGDSFMYKVGQMLLMLVFPDIQINAQLHGKDLTTEADMENLDYLRNQDPELTGIPELPELAGYQSSQKAARTRQEVGLDIQQLLHEEAMEKFRYRQLQIMRQMKVIFIYPVSYMLLWLFPFVAQCYQLHRGRKAYYHLSIFCLAAFFQAFNCFIDTMVFFIREQPWNLRASQVDPFAQYEYSWLRKKLGFLPGYRLGNPDAISPQITAPSHQDPLTSHSHLRAIKSRSSSQIDPKDVNQDNSLSLADFLNSSAPKTVPSNVHSSTRQNSKFSWRTFSLRGSLTESYGSDEHKEARKKSTGRKGSAYSAKTSSTDGNAKMDLMCFLKEETHAK